VFQAEDAGKINQYEQKTVYVSPVTGVALNDGRKSRSRENLKAQIDSSRVRQRKRT
jgi:hypothetical protein